MSLSTLSCRDVSLCARFAANALVEKQRASLVDMHKDACPWRTRQCEDSVYRVPLQSPSFTARDLRATTIAWEFDPSFLTRCICGACFSLHRPISCSTIRPSSMPPRTHRALMPKYRHTWEGSLWVWDMSKLVTEDKWKGLHVLLNIIDMSPAEVCLAAIEEGTKLGLFALSTICSETPELRRTIQDIRNAQHTHRCATGRANASHGNQGCRRPELYTQHMPKGRGGGRANFGHPKPEGRSNFFKYCSCDFCNQTLDNPAQPHVTFTRPGNSCDPLREFNNYSANVNAMLQNLEITTIDGSQNTPMISETTAATPMGSTVTN